MLTKTDEVSLFFPQHVTATLVVSLSCSVTKLTVTAFVWMVCLGRAAMSAPVDSLEPSRTATAVISALPSGMMSLVS